MVYSGADPIRNPDKETTNNFHLCEIDNVLSGRICSDRKCVFNVGWWLISQVQPIQTFDYTRVVYLYIFIFTLIPVSLAPQGTILQIKCVCVCLCFSSLLEFYAFCFAVTQLYMCYLIRIHLHIVCARDCRFVYFFLKLPKQQISKQKMMNLFFAPCKSFHMKCGCVVFFSSSIQFIESHEKMQLPRWNMKCACEKSDNSFICMWNDRCNDYFQFDAAIFWCCGTMHNAHAIYSLDFVIKFGLRVLPTTEFFIQCLL